MTIGTISLDIKGLLSVVTNTTGDPFSHIRHRDHFMFLSGGIKAVMAFRTLKPDIRNMGIMAEDGISCLSRLEADLSTSNSP